MKLQRFMLHRRAYKSSSIVPQNCQPAVPFSRNEENSPSSFEPLAGTSLPSKGSTHQTPFYTLTELFFVITTPSNLSYIPSFSCTIPKLTIYSCLIGWRFFSLLVNWETNFTSQAQIYWCWQISSIFCGLMTDQEVTLVVFFNAEHSW